MKCPCGANAEQLEQYYPDGETDFRLCKICGCVFRENFPTKNELDEIYRDAYSKTNVDAENTNQESGNYALKSYADYLMEEVLVPKNKVLDYGAGTGAFVEELRVAGYDVQGVEYSESAREYCLLKRGFTLKGNLSDVPDGYYDVVSMIEVIEHLTDLDATLKDIYRVLSPNGMLLVTTPNRKGLRARIQKGNWREARKKFHLFLFDRKSLDFHLKRLGFMDVRRNVFSPLQKPGLIFALYSRITQMLGLSGTLFVLAKK